VQQSLVQPFALPDRKDGELVGVVGDEYDACRDRLAVDGDAEGLTVRREDREAA
jgi:hypothetical protein